MNSITARNKSEKRFKMYGKVAVTVAISFLVILLYKILDMVYVDVYLNDVPQEIHLIL